MKSNTSLRHWSVRQVQPGTSTSSPQLSLRNGSEYYSTHEPQQPLLWRRLHPEPRAKLQKWTDLNFRIFPDQPVTVWDSLSPYQNFYCENPPSDWREEAQWICWKLNYGCVPNRILFLFTFSTCCCMQYANSWDRLLCHDVAPWTLTLMLIHQSRGLWVRKACWLAYCKMRPDAGHPGICGTLHLTYYKLNGMVVWILERTLWVCREKSEVFSFASTVRVWSQRRLVDVRWTAAPRQLIGSQLQWKHLITD